MMISCLDADSAWPEASYQQRAHYDDSCRMVEARYCVLSKSNVRFLTPRFVGYVSVKHGRRICSIYSIH